MQNSLYSSIFKKEITDHGNRAFLEQVAKDYPYFSPAQFFLLQQADPGSLNYTVQAARTAIHFNNPHWLNFQLQGSTFSHEKVKHEPTLVLDENPQVRENIILDPGIIPPVELEATENDTEDDSKDEAEIAPIKLEFKMPPGSKDDQLLFEPMHLVDYFASQGIKLSEDIQPADKLGKQLKSFTEWLKTMKKIHSGAADQALPVTEANPAQTEAAIQSLAEKSNAEDEILTESMAEVLAKQGKYGRALEVYQKLSLLNPPKSAYFAAKIENLKGE